MKIPLGIGHRDNHVECGRCAPAPPHGRVEGRVARRPSDETVTPEARGAYLRRGSDSAVLNFGYGRVEEANLLANVADQAPAAAPAV